MRKVTQQIAKAFKNNQKCTISNTMTDGQSVFLHGNKIAWKQDGKLHISMCGWPTPTTRERINGILDAFGSSTRICQRKGEQGFCTVGLNASLFGKDNFEPINENNSYWITNTHGLKTNVHYLEVAV